MSDRLILILAAIGLVPIAFSYGIAPSKTVTYLLGFPVEGTNQTHVFRAIMGLYLANVLFWLSGAFIEAVRRPAVWSLFIFMWGLAAGRIISIVVDGMPNFVLIFYLCAEIAFGALALVAIRKNG
ncbi:DUF4345 domain-containing protein [Pelagimonas varians]|uniref:DUF4345 domain-containing protein n=1 Tax=Pelagimonas varians TaxID=696760 RepID=A0A238KSQ8_9RHOB|nr:DUF4345 domain-containing protein [Pelagimonas varians]PYG32541.1 uncharacterized protein DUF4345 [Pelagimonas varians]SMX45869.1 hypothetical protein PEV8663_03134 [Pelagimonas varians]